MVSERRQLLRVADLIDIAIGMETAGERFYLRAAKLSHDTRLKKTFDFLANEEKHHRDQFEARFERKRKLESEKELPEGYHEYLNVFGSTLLFDEEELEQIMDRIKTSQDAIDFAIQREKDSMLFYYEISQFLPENEQDIVGDILNEERKHYEILTNIKGIFD